MIFYCVFIQEGKQKRSTAGFYAVPLHKFSALEIVYLSRLTNLLRKMQLNRSLPFIG